MFENKSVARLLSLGIVSIALSACGGGEGDSTPPARNVGSISGNVFDAPVNGATIQVWEYEDGKIGRKLGSTTSDAFGDYKVSIESISQPVLISAQGGSYTDPLTNETISVSNGKIIRLDSVVNFSEGSNHKAMLTPLSNIAAGLAKYKMAQGVSSRDAVSQSISTVSDMYGFDINKTEPVDITRGGQSSYASDGHKYGALLTAYSSFSHDLISKYGDDNHTYTSMHLADIQYRDVVSDGYLNGEEISELNGALTPLSFGQVSVTSDVYTNLLAQHVLIVVNDPNLNVSGTSADDYVEFSQQINDLGTGGADGVVPPRDVIEIDTTPPDVKRVNTGVLAGLDSVDISLHDEIGVKSVSAYIQYQRHGTWSEELVCDDGANYGNEYCSVDFTDFEQGLRETSARIMINTTAMDGIYGDEELYTSEARVILYTSDVLGNQLKPVDGQGHIINFEWDNESPVIKVTSANTINNGVPEYILKGTVKEEYQDISSVTVAFNGGVKEEVKCTPLPSEVGNACEFSNPYLTDDFVSTTVFDIEASDSKGNVGNLVHTVSRDDQRPTQVVTYPSSGTLMTYVKVGVDGERTMYDGAYTQNTYTEGTVQSSRDYLKIDFLYASNGIKNSIEGVDFKNFNVNLLKEKKIPYLEVKVSDNSYDSVLGSNADKLTLVVEYYVSRNNDGNYSLQNVTKTIGSDENFTANIPHKTISKDGDGRVNEVVYYIPYVKEVLGDSFSSTAEESSQKLVIKTIDESENESSIQEVFFRSSFDLPTMKVVTPFIGARVQLEGLSANGEFTPLSSCVTAQEKEENSGNITLDVASCETMTDLMNYEFMRMRLISVATPVSHYYQWKKDASEWQAVDLNKANIGAYFILNGSQTFYLTELSVYQTGLFDNQWNQVAAGEKTVARAKQVLDDVTRALAGSNNDSFFGFDPTIVSYATNELLTTKPIPNNPTNDYLHRFLVEGIVELSKDMPRSNSLDFASAMYDDFSYDGKANGIGEGNTQITLDTYEFSSKTYRTHLAQAYFDVMTGVYGVAENIAQLYADDISMANPESGGKSIFDGPGESIDKLPPQTTLSIDLGREVTVNNKRFVAGEIAARILLKDPSGIVTVEGSQPKFATMWYNATEPSSPKPIDVNITAGSNGDSYSKEYFFTLDTQLPELKEMVEFALNTSAKDTHGNSYGYDGKEPYIESLYIDNDYPVASYTPPNDVQGKPIDPSIYLNAKNVHELTFAISDVVGDKRDVRGLVFYKPTGEKATFTAQDFSANSQDSFKVKLCTGDVCNNQGNTIYPGDGNWLVVVRAEDNLNNSVSELISTAPRFNVLIDSEAPVVSGGAIEEKLGGNSIWTPVINWGSLSQGSDVQIDLRRGSGQAVRLSHCDPAAEVCDLPYLIGEQPDVKVQLVAGAFDYLASNEFYVTATDKAYPSNVSTQGIFTFKVDNIGPEIRLNTPWVEDALSKESYVLGREFSVRFTSVTDDSKIDQVSLFQEGFPNPIKTMTPVDPSQPFVMSLNKSETDRIDTTGQEKTTALYVKTTDVNGFESQTNINHIILDREGPALRLSGYNENDYYLGNYVFNLIAQDLNSNGNASVEGVDKESLEYWTFSNTEPQPGTPGSNIGNDFKVPLNDLSTGIYSLRLKGSDVRGNETITTSNDDIKIKVNNALPQVTLAMSYIDGTPITNNTIYQEGNIILTLDVVDESGVDKIDSSYKLVGEQNGTSLTFVEQEPGKWTATLLETQIAADGRYELDIKVYNKVRYLNESDRKVGVVNQTLSVQRQGVVLSIESPADFQNYKANSALNVTFNTQSEVKAKTLECWVREAYNSEEAPPTNEAPYSGVINVSQEPYSCSLASTKSMSQAPVTLITRTVATNGRETVSKFNFAMMDVDAPTVVDGNSYSFNHNDVWFDEAQNNKMLTFDLTYNDELAGVNTSEKAAYPKLVRLQGNRAFTPTQCTTGVGNVKCTYSELYSDIINGLSVTQEYKITQLSDVAGNLTPDHDILLQLPQGNVEVLITDPVGNTTVNGEKMVVKFRIKLYENSRLDNLVARVGSKSYNYKDSRNNFTQLEVCSDAPEYQCSEFNSDLPANSDGQTLKTTITATDVWARSGEDSVDIRIDNSAPLIGDEVIVTPSDANPGKVRFRFDITDTGSGVDTVNYAVLNPNHQEEKVEDGNGSASYFELDATQLENRDSITVDIIATDKVGLYTSIRKIIDVSSPQVTLAFEAGASIENGKLLFKNNTQAFSISTVDSAGIQATAYSIDFQPTVGAPLSYTGNIVSSNASGTMNFTVDEQAVYDFTVTVTDSIGRKTKTFQLFGKSYDARGLASVVDHELPTIASVTASQTSPIPTNGKYPVDVTVFASDKNLETLTSTANGSKGLVNPESMTLPVSASDPYIIHYLFEPGSYTVNVSAVDLANQTANSTVNTTVTASSTPALTISNSKVGVLAGGEQVTLTFAFTEEVAGFDSSDVLITANGGDSGQLVNGTWNTADNITWTTKYQAPTGTLDTITIKVNDGSFKSLNDIAGIGDILTAEVDGVAPTLLSVEFNPKYQAVGQGVNTKLVFSEEVEEVSAALGVNSITNLSATIDKTVWVGDVVVPNTSSKSIVLSVTGLKDKVGNIGLDDTSHTLPVTPVVSVDFIADIDLNSASTLPVTGASQRFDFGEQITLKAVDKNMLEVTGSASVKMDGSWETTLDVSTLAEGAITVYVNGTNDLSASAEEVNTSFTLSSGVVSLLKSNTELERQDSAWDLSFAA
ncbi:hypothetical protein [Vibrio intestinalis]|uniref:hypothetical protein n=1 Tax=Vibrio intestinalis TaxID=2933291 RepID=UPI0021A759F5|nr:hypothetical protein [Vibrio intestinalis]